MNRIIKRVLIITLLLALLPVTSVAQTTSNSCTLGGAYTSNWVGINIDVLLLWSAVIGAVFAVSQLFPGKARAAASGIVRAETVQLFISLFIIIALLTVSSAACGISSGISSKLLNTPNLNPFQYAEYYTENLSMNTGMGFLSYLYTTGMSYAIYSGVLSELSKDMLSGKLFPNFNVFSSVKVSSSFGYSLGKMLSSFSTAYMDFFSEILLIMISMLMLQWLSLPFIQSLAFTLVLPLALILRSVPFGAFGSDSKSGRGLRDIGNTLLALAIAFYIIYPMMIVFNSYAVSYIFSPNNQLYSCTNCLGAKVTPLNIPESYFSSSLSYSLKANEFGGFVSPSILGFITGPIFNNIGLILPNGIFDQVEAISFGLAKFIFYGLFMFGIDLTVTIGFASSLKKALNSGVSGTGSFWDSL